MENFFQRFLNQVNQKYKEADKATGGWLPGGGTAAPPVRAMQTAAPIAGRLASTLRDQVVIPVLDKGIETGVLPTKEAMFARYLTGTSKPLTVYPKPLLNEISNVYNNAAIQTTKDDVDKIFKQSPLYRQYETAQNELTNLSSKLRDRAEMTGVEPSFEELQKVHQYEQKRNELRKSANLPGYYEPYQPLPSNVLNNQERLNIIQKNNLVQPKNITITYDAAYNVMPDEVQLSLGRFDIKDNNIIDRYKFDDLQLGRRQIEGRGNVYPDAAGGNVLGSNLIELGLKTKILNPGSGYDIKIPYLK